MTPPEPLKNKEPVSTLSRKKAVMVIVILLAIAIISVIAVVILVPSPSGSSVTTSPAVVKNTLGPAGSQTGGQPNTQPADATPVMPVDFFIDAGTQEKCGLTCRQLTPSIINTGYETAHNVCISIVLSNSGGDLISLNGEPSFRKCIGNIASGESKSEPIVINADCGFLASKCIRQTLILKTKATCDETTVQFPDQIIAV